MGKICFFPKCVPKNRDFVVFPFTRTPEFENWWIKSGWVNWIHLDGLPSKILICEEHFEKHLINRRYKVPRLALGALPTLNVECPQPKREPLFDAETQNKELLLHRVFCRLCGQMQSSNLAEDVELLGKLDDIFVQQLQLSTAGPLPLGVCHRCKETANVVHAFWKECSEAQETLRTIFNNDPSSDVPFSSNVSNVQLDDKLEDTKTLIAQHGDQVFLTKDSLPPECEEVEIDEITGQVIEQHFPNGYVCESYVEEFPVIEPHSNQPEISDDECDGQVKLDDCEMQLIQDDYTIEYDGDSSCQEITADLTSSDKEEKKKSSKKTPKKPEEEEAHICEVFNYMLTQHKIRVHNMVIEGVKLYSTSKEKKQAYRKKIELNA
uniref:Uncharacterized protein n=1 Tax=Anopheles dirus TaxID=7168 RepID=A0A182NG70_9DIPT